MICQSGEGSALSFSLNMAQLKDFKKRRFWSVQSSCLKYLYFTEGYRRVGASSLIPSVI